MIRLALVGLRTLLLVVVHGGCGCSGPLSDRGSPAKRAPGQGDAGVDGGDGSLAVSAEPSDISGVIEPYARFVLASADSSRVGDTFLLTGLVTPELLRDLKDGQANPSNRKRLVPMMAWPSDPPYTSRVLSPESLLEVGSTVSIVEVTTGRFRTFEVRASPLPILSRVWPAASGAARSELAMFCGERPLPDGLSLVGPTNQLGPLEIKRGTPLDHESNLCVTVTGLAMSSPVALAPLLSGPSGPAAFLSGSHLPQQASPRPVGGGGCSSPHVQFGHSCVAVDDDRLVVTTPEFALTSASVAGKTHVAAGPAAVITVKGLTARSEYDVAVDSVDEGGRVSHDTRRVRTSAARLHLVLNEVLANPLGPEPASEWVELHNDGVLDLSAKGVTIADGSAVVTLPDFTLPAGAFALVVNEGFVEGLAGDVAPKPGTLLLRVPRLGNGLSNEGEVLTLRGSDGVTLSSFPAAPKPKPGQSVCRVSDAGGAAGEFVLVSVADVTPGSENRAHE